MAIANGQVLSQAVNFAERRKAGKHCRTSIQEVAIRCVERILQPANEHVIVGAEGVVHTSHVVWPLELGRRVPAEPARVQAVADSEVVWQRELVDQRDYRSICARATWVTAKNIVGVHAVPGDCATADSHPGMQGAAGIHEAV